jgi:hypothetical protein
MKILTHFFVSTYSRMLRLYPHKFQNEFAEEMQVVFSDSIHEASKGGIFPLVLLWLRELVGLPFNILREFWYEFGRKETIMVTNAKVEQEVSNSVRSSHWEAFLSALPFAVFGVVCMIGKIRVPWVGIYVYVAFYLFVLLGLLIGLVKAFPRWAYSYLGWSLVCAWWWTDMYTKGFRLFGYTFGDEAWGWRAWAPLFLTVGIAILLTRSLRPLRELIHGIWQDWTLLSLALYSLVGFILLLYDEVHSPYLYAFMTASTLLVSASVWIFMRNTNRFHRFVILPGSFFAGLLINYICNTTWDYATYYGLTAQPPKPWYISLFQSLFFFILWSPIVWLPALIGLFKSTFNKEQTS